MTSLATDTDRADRPILLNGPSVCAVLAGAKTQTRSPVQPQPAIVGSNNGWYWSSPKYDNGDGVHYAHTDEGSLARLMLMACPFGQPGDKLWVRETIRWNPEHDNAYYSADSRGVGNEVYFRLKKEGRLKVDRPISSTHMPRWASRITLEITSIKAQRIQSVSEKDARAEGAAWRISEGGDLTGAFEGFDAPIGYRAHFRDLWDSIYKGAGLCWEANPWVWAASFRLIKRSNVR